ncbi:hypothetical protein [Rhodohalobacter sulfatireducens]|uniref:VapC45 PIN like domain-containing protein n=1 Tax=Rhodohalobacter sulfatireducens TaxID=2911366 RepID=A0ABS9K8P3_9BACT|nr:hypothetical protein [Rhodohalobacter sulfatireducens]MCG2587183.1 hypothetical protein [Rhodohalobacter sulfatireducens]
MAILQNPRVDEQIEVFTIRDEIGKGTPDEKWIPEVAAEDGIVITQDLSIHRVRQQRDLYRQHGLGVVFFKPPKNGYQYWDLVEFYIKRWKAVKGEVKKLKKPFALIVTPRSAKPERL